MLLSGILSAQTNDCIDDLAISPTFQCTAPFSPVCGCDNKSYFNACDAIFHGGIRNNNYVEGVCGDAAMFLGQDAQNKLIRMFFQFKESGGSLTFLIVDIYGKVIQQQFIASRNNFPLQFDFSTASFPAGIYIAYAFGGNFRKTIKFSAGSL